jgi:hypothetical protein
MKKRLATAAAAFLMLGSAQAQMPPMTSSALYGELGYTFLKMDALGTSFRPDALRGIIGWDVHPMFAIEGMVAGGVNDDSKSVSIAPGTATAKMDYMYGIWIKPKYVFEQYRSELFGRFGWAHTKPEVSRPGFPSVSASDDDFAWGIGANYRFNPNGYVGIDWMRYSNQSDSHIDGLTFSVGWHW